MDVYRARCDYYDFVNISNKRLFLSIGDVAGKGVPAALLMANAMAALNNFQQDDITMVILKIKP